MRRGLARLSCALTTASGILVAAGGCTTALNTGAYVARKGMDAPEVVGSALKPGSVACASAHGGYYLPRARLHVAIKKEENGDFSAVLEKATTLAPERSRLFCLDYLGSALSSDLISVSRTEDGLLTSITSSVEDRTPAIVEKLAETAKNIALAAARDLRLSVAPNHSLDLVFDPFDADEAQLAKKALDAFGACISVDGAPCGQPGKAFSGDDPALADAMADGVLYRPLLPVKIELARPPRRGRPPIVTNSIYIDMPNGAPVMSIKVERALFATRKTELAFDSGVLTGVRVGKGSELEGAVRMPLAVATAALSIPQELITLRITDSNNRAALIDAQGKLMNALATLQTARAGGRALTGRAFSNCLDGLGNAPDCARALGGFMQ